MASERDLRDLAAIVSEDRPDLPDGGGLPPSLLGDLMRQIRCDALSLDGRDIYRQRYWFSQEIPSGIDYAAFDQVFWENHRDCQDCIHAARKDAQHRVVKVSDFYSARQWHSTGMYTDHDRPLGFEHSLMLNLPEAPARAAEPGRYVRLTLARGPGPDFSERDRAVLTLLRPHLHQAYLDAERRRHPTPGSRRGTGNCCTCSPPGTQTPRSPAA
jgi:hypothetical protein